PGNCTSCPGSGLWPAPRATRPGGRPTSGPCGTASVALPFEGGSEVHLTLHREVLRLRLQGHERVNDVDRLAGLERAHLGDHLVTSPIEPSLGQAVDLLLPRLARHLSIPPARGCRSSCGRPR